MKTVLGLSVTAAGVGWVLVEGTTPVDDDKFAVRDPEELVPRCLAAVRGAQSIAASSGRAIESIGVCWSADVHGRMNTLLAELRATGCSDVRSVRQVTPVDDQDGDGPAAEHPERVDPCGLLAQLLTDDTDGDPGPDEDIAPGVEFDATSAPGAETTSAYGAAQAVVSNASPPEPVEIVRRRRSWTPQNWTPAVSGTRIGSAAAVAAAVALFAVGSQFVGPTDRSVQEPAALANRSSDSTAHTSQIVQPDPPAAQPMAVPEPVQPTLAAPPAQQPAVPPARAVEYQAPASVPDAAPVVAPQVQEVIAEAVPHIPESAAPPPPPPAAAPDPTVPLAPPEVIPPAPPVPFWLAPPFVPAPPPPPPPPGAVVPAPEALAAPVEQPAPPAPVPPPAVNPVLGALP